MRPDRPGVKHFDYFFLHRFRLWVFVAQPSRYRHCHACKTANKSDSLLHCGRCSRLKKPAHTIGKITQNFALHQDEANTAAAMGNTPAMVHRHYRALATADEAREFFGIMPPRAA